MRMFAAHPRGNRVLGIGRRVKVDAKLGPGGAGAAFAHHGQGRGHGAVHHLHQRLKPHSLGQAFFQGRHIHDPGECFHPLGGGIEMHAAVLITLYLHVLDGGGVFSIGPAAQRFEQAAGRCIQGIGPYVGGRRAVWARCWHQGHLQSFPCQQQGQGSAHDAGATNTDIKSWGHERHCRRGLTPCDERAELRSGLSGTLLQEHPA